MTKNKIAFVLKSLISGCAGGRNTNGKKNCQKKILQNYLTRCDK